ncbi:MAG: DUF2807 domain-containing protein [Prevotella sp.]|nr:DUF2807 domain-containing protein [Prevotella sp.]
MRKAVLLMACTVIVLTSCRMNLKGWSTDLIEASDKVVTKEYKLTPFEEVKMNGVGQVELVQSETRNGVVELTAPDNYIELYKFDSDGKELDISFAKKGINIHTKNVKIKVYTSDLVRIENRGAASISMDSLDTDQIEIVNSGVGDIKISGITDDAYLTCSGVGSIRAEGLKALNVKASVSGVGSIECNASEEIEGRVSGVGSLRYSGNPKHQDNKRTGIGSISKM